MNRFKIAAALTLAGVVLAIVGLITSTDPTPRAGADEPLPGTGSLDQINGLAPIDEVVDLFEKRSQQNADDYLSRTQLGQALNTQARELADLEGYEAAEVVLTEALSINPRWRPAQLALAQALHSQHRFTEARDLAQEIVNDDSRSLPALALLGDAQFELGDLAAALDAYGELAEVERSAPVVSRLARHASVSGDGARAVELATEALELSQADALRPNAAAFYWFQLGRMHFEIGAVDDAVAAYEQALAIDPGNAAATESLGFTLAAIGDHEGAVAMYRELVATGPAPDLHGALSDALRALGREDEAGEQERLGSELAAETMDRFPAERRHLVGFFLSRDSAVAVELARADFAERRDLGAYDTLAWALFNDGQATAAADILDQGPAGDPPFAAMLYHQAEIRAAVGDTGEAVRLAEAALALNPSFDPAEADAARALIASIRD